MKIFFVFLQILGLNQDLTSARWEPCLRVRVADMALSFLILRQGLNIAELASNSCVVLVGLKFKIVYLSLLSSRDERYASPYPVMAILYVFFRCVYFIFLIKFI